jgi:YD repeat-containing protein
MKKLKLFFTLLIGLTILSCSTDDNSTDDIITEKKLTQIIFQSQSTQNVIYDSSGKVIEINDNNGLVLSSNTYNSSNKLTKQEFNEYDNGILYFKEIDNLTYNSDNKISNIEHISFFYNSDGSVSSQNSINNIITYSSNSMIRTVDDFWNTRVEFGLTNDLITSIKVYRSNELKSDMLFNYDSDGNCISGTGPIDQGSLDSTTDNIDLNVTYGVEEKNSFFNMFFDYEILTFTSFYNLRQVLINQQGNKYPEIIQWYQYSDYIYKETNDNSFDNDGYITSRILSEFPDYPNYGTINFTWE